MDKKDDRVLGMKLARDDITAEVKRRVLLSTVVHLRFNFPRASATIHSREQNAVGIRLDSFIRPRSTILPMAWFACNC